MKGLGKFMSLTAGALVMMLASSAAFADAFEGLSMMRMGDWEVDFSGNVNGFFTNGDCDPDVEGAVVAGGLACGSNGVDSDFGDVRTGLLPSWLNFYAATVTDRGVKTAVHLSFQPGIHSGVGDLGGSLSGALGLNESNFRQVFLTFGTDDFGTIKIGRDLGVFGSDAILNDMTLLGVGTASDLTNGESNTSLGRIGIGYIYADWKAQIQYASPNYNGFSFTAALIDPWGAGTITGNANDRFNSENRNRPLPYPYSATSAGDKSSGEQEKDTYGFEAKVNYSGDIGGGSLGLWASYFAQSIDWENNLNDVEIIRLSDNTTLYEFAGDDSADADAWDIGAKIAFGGFDVVGYYYDGDGIGTTAALLDGVDVVGEERDSDGYYVQARYRLPNIGTLLGVSYGESNLDETDLDKARLRANPDVYSLVESNESFIIGAYHPIGEALNLVVEYTNTEAESHNGNEAEEDLFAVGAIMFF